MQGKHLALLFLMVTGLLTGCGEAITSETDSHTEPAVTVAANKSKPSIVKLVEVSSIASDSLTVSWLPADDDDTPHDKISYGIHLSNTSGFQPTSSTLVKNVVGETSTQLDKLTAGQAYYVIVTATDTSGNTSWSNILAGQVVNLSAKRTSATVHKLSPSQARLARNSNTIPLAQSQPIEVGDYLVSSEDGGSLQKVKSVMAARGGDGELQTEAASLNEVFTDIAFATRVKLHDLPANTSSGKGFAARSAMSGQSGTAHWDNSGLTLFGSNNTATASSGFAQRLVVDGDKQTDEGNYFNLSGPAYASAEPDEPFQIMINAEIFKENSGSPLELCKIELSSFEHDSSAHNSLPKPTGNFMQSNNAAGKPWTGTFTVDWSPSEQHVDTEGKPYKAVIRAYVDEVGENCNGGNWFGTWEDKLDLEIPVYVAQGTPDSSAVDLEITFTDPDDEDFVVKDQISYDIKPEMIIGAEISSGTLQTASIQVETDLSFTNKFIMTAQDEASLDGDVTSTRILEKKFIKVFSVGPVPVVVSGAFSIDVELEGSVSGEVALEKLLELRLPDTLFGLVYDKNNGSWKTINNFAPEYTFQIDGEANARAGIKLKLVPGMKVSFYNAASGDMLVEPYLFADAELHGQFKYLDENGTELTDLDYWFEKLEAGAGAWL